VCDDPIENAVVLIDIPQEPAGVPLDEMPDK